MEVINFLEDLNEKFPQCFFTKRGNKIIVHENSYIDGEMAYTFVKLKDPYELGINIKLSSYLEEKGYYWEINKKDEVVIKQN